MFSCLQILEAFLWFVLITLLNVTLIILTLSVSRLLNLLLRLVAFLLFLNPQCLASISRWITASSSWKRFCLFVCRALSSIMVICMLTDRKSGSAGMPRPISYAVFCLKKKKNKINILHFHDNSVPKSYDHRVPPTTLTLTTLFHQAFPSVVLHST